MVGVSGRGYIIGWCQGARDASFAWREIQGLAERREREVKSVILSSGYMTIKGRVGVV